MNVKQSLFCMAMLCAIVTSSNAQDNVAIMAGINQNTIIVDPNPGLEYQDVNFFFVGISIEEYLSSRIKLNTFLQYAQKGADIESPAIPAPGAVRQRSQYIDLIPNVEFKLNNALGLYVGGSASYHLRTDLRLGNGGYMKIGNDTFKRLSYGSVAGAKLYFGTVALNFHWNRDWTETTSAQFTDANGNPIGTGKLFNQSFQLGMTLYL